MDFVLSRQRVGLISRTISYIFLLQTAATGLAQSQPVLPQVVVTAGRYEQALAQAPIGATVLSGNDIVDSGVADANEAVHKLGGLMGRRDLNGGHDDLIDIRGYGDSSLTNLVVLVNGVRISENELAAARLAAISPAMIERIEIVRGGASVLWGEGATSGVINVITREASAPGVHGSVRLGAESYGGQDVQGEVSANTSDMKLFAQVRDYQNTGFRKNGAYMDTAANAGVTVGDARDLMARFTAFSDVSHMRWPGALTLDQFAQDGTQSTTLQDSGVLETERYGLLLEKKTEDLTLSLDLANRQRNTHSEQFWGGYAYSNLDTHSSSNQVSPRILMTVDSSSMLLNALFGMDFYQWEYNYNDVLYPLANRATQSSSAAYIKLDGSTPDGWRMTAGLRKEGFSQQIDDLTDNLHSSTAPQMVATDLGISRTLATHWTAYTRIATSYRIANVDELRTWSPPGVQLLLPQETRDFEGGLRYEQGRDSVALRAFMQSTTHEIALYTDSNNNISNINLDPISRQGLELEAQTASTAKWLFSGSAQMMHAVFTSGPNNGNQVPLTANAHLNARARYVPDAATSLDAAIRWVSQMPFGNDWANQCNAIPSAQFLDLAYQYRLKVGATTSWTFRASVDNVTDRRTYSNGYTNSSCTAYNVYPDLGQVVKLSGVYSF